MRDDDFKKSVSPSQTGERERSAAQVYIMYKRLEKKLTELEKLAAVVGVMLEEELSQGSSDNNVMLPSERGMGVFPSPE